MTLFDFHFLKELVEVGICPLQQADDFAIVSSWWLIQWLFSWCCILELLSHKILFISLTCSTLNDQLQNKGAGGGNHGPKRGFLPVEFDP